jgi:hypothetical protein
MNVPDPILCFYINSTDKLQLAQLQSHSSFERLVFPGEKFMFEALPEEVLGIYTYTTSGITLLKNVVCQDIQVHQRDAGKR